MKTKNIQLGNTVVEAVEENGVVTVRIQSQDAVVYVNEDMVWSIGNDREEFKYVPHVFHDFLLKSGLDHIKYDEKEKETTADVYVDGEQLSFYFPTNKNKHIHSRFDLITSVEEVKDFLSELEDAEKTKPFEEELVKRFNAFKEFVASKGYKLAFSHAMNEWAYAWWDIVFLQSEWNEEEVVAIMKEANEFNDFIRKMRDELNF
jgi:hypothetical protein